MEGISSHILSLGHPNKKSEASTVSLVISPIKIGVSPGGLGNPIPNGAGEASGNNLFPSATLSAAPAGSPEWKMGWDQFLTEQ